MRSTNLSKWFWHQNNNACCRKCFTSRQCIGFDPGICLIDDCIESAMIRHALGISIAPGTEIISMPVKKKSPGRPKKAAKKKTAKKSPTRVKAAKKSGKNKLGVKNSLVNNINAKKKKGKARSKEDSTISRKSYEEMKDNWGKD